jgi:hypothetical protein
MRRLKLLMAAWITLSAPAWGQGPTEKQMIWQAEAFRAGFKAAKARECGALNLEAFATIKRQIGAEAIYIGRFLGREQTLAILQKFADGEDLVRRGFEPRQCSMLQPSELEALRAMAAGQITVLSP